MKSRTVVACVMLLICSLSGCEAQPQQDLHNVLLGTDHYSPVLLEAYATGRYTAEYRFDEMIFSTLSQFTVVSSDAESQRIIDVHPYEETVTLEFASPLVPGRRTQVRGTVADKAGNTLSFSVGVWGYNDRVPSLLINEFSTKGSSANPDRVEMLALSDGNLAGVALYHGMPDIFDSETVFPSWEVSTGDYLVVVFGNEPETLPEGWLWGGDVGLGANNGVVSLASRPQGDLIDAVLYSNRTSDSDENYHGFGTRKVQLWAQSLEASGHWDSLPVTPESGVDSTHSTATRSFCRTEGEPDTDSRDDWHIVPTRGATFGEKNSEEVYRP